MAVAAVAFPQIQGGSFDEAQDGDRLRAQHEAIWAVMQDGDWHTLESLQHELFTRYAIRAKTTGISARLRDFQKEECGKHTVHDSRVEGHSTLWQHRLEVNPNAAYEIARYKRMNVRGKAAVSHDTLIVDGLVEQFALLMERVEERPMHMKGFIAQLRDRLLPIAENHMLALWDEADRQPLKAAVSREPAMQFSPEI